MYVPRLSTWGANGTAPGARLSALAQTTGAEFIPALLDDTRMIASCPSGYKLESVSQDQIGATLVNSVAGGVWYARCIRQDIFDQPQLSKTEPVYPPGYTPVSQEKSWGDWLRDTFGLSYTPWVIGGVVVILGTVVVLRVLR